MKILNLILAALVVSSSLPVQASQKDWMKAGANLNASFHKSFVQHRVVLPVGVVQGGGRKPGEDMPNCELMTVKSVAVNMGRTGAVAGGVTYFLSRIAESKHPLKSGLRGLGVGLVTGALYGYGATPHRCNPSAVKRAVNNAFKEGASAAFFASTVTAYFSVLLESANPWRNVKIVGSIGLALGALYGFGTSQ